MAQLQSVRLARMAGSCSHGPMAKQDGVFALWRLCAGDQAVCLDTLRVFSPQRTEAILQSSRAHLTPIPLKQLPTISQAINTAQPVFEEDPGPDWQTGLGGESLTELRLALAELSLESVLIPSYDGPVALGVLGIAGRRLSRDYFPMLAPLGAVLIACSELEDALTDLMATHRSDVLLQRILEDLIQPLTATMARIEVVLELYASGDFAELSEHIRRLRNSGERLIRALTSPVPEGLIQLEHFRLNRCASTATLLLAVTR